VWAISPARNDSPFKGITRMRSEVFAPPNKIGLTSQICNGNFGEGCKGALPHKLPLGDHRLLGRQLGQVQASLQAIADRLAEAYGKSAELTRYTVKLADSCNTLRGQLSRALDTKHPLTAAAAARDQATALLVSLVTQLVAEKRKRYLADSHITELDLIALNQVLAPQGLQIRSEFRHSERQVACTLKNGMGQRTVFWREAVKPGTITAEA
jgi:hypothetical protein